MDYQKWLDCTWSDPKEYKDFEAQMMEDAQAQLEAQGLKVVKTLPNQYLFGIVAGTADGRKWLHITISDVREGDAWFKNVKLRRMSSERDWKGDEFHYCAWDELGAAVLKYMGDEYDDEIL